MHTLVLLATMAAATAQSGESGRADGFGIGAQTTLRGLGSADLGIGPSAGLSVVFGQDKWRVSTLLDVLFVEDTATAFSIGGRFLYAIHSRKSADFSVGAGVALQLVDFEDEDDTDVSAYFEGVAQIRVFLAKNVSLNGTLGLGFRVGEGPFVFALGSQATGSFGMTYFF